MKGPVILGISAFYHDSAACLLVDGSIVAAAQEERFSRKKNDDRFPEKAIAYVLQEGGCVLDDLDAVVFYDKPMLKFERIAETYHGFAPFGLKQFMVSMPVWIKEKLFFRRMLKRHFKEAFGYKIKQLLFTEHHLSHAASAFYPSPYKEAAILTVDGVGEWATASIALGRGTHIEVLRELHFPHSLGLFYSAVTQYLGFKVNSGEYKVMGLSSYGRRDGDEVKRVMKLLLDEVVDIREDGSILLNMAFFSFGTHLRMTKNDQWQKLLGFPQREATAILEAVHVDLALAAQLVVEKVMLALARTTKAITGSDRLVLAGGVALNCVANAQVVQSGLFKEVWIQPAAGDAGGALGAALAAHHGYFEEERNPNGLVDGMANAYLGPEYSDKEIKRLLDAQGATYTYFNTASDLVKAVAGQLANGNIVGWFQGRMEFGPRALGNRSILADPRDNGVQQRLNAKVKFRESFRPFAPSVLEEDYSHYFKLPARSPYMLLVSEVRDELRTDLPSDYYEMGLQARLGYQKSSIPAVTHVDHTARVQTVSKSANPLFHDLISAFKEITGLGMVVNTSFNIKDEPVVCTPAQAYRDFRETRMDVLVMGNFVLEKEKQKQSEIRS